MTNNTPTNQGAETMTETQDPKSITVTTHQSIVREQYGDDDTAQVVLECAKCGGKGYIFEYRYVDGGVCYDCDGRPELARRYTTVGKLMANAKRRDQREAAKARKLQETREALDAWKEAHKDLLVRAEAVGLDSWKSWKNVPTDQDVARITEWTEEREAKRAARAAKNTTPVQAGRVRITGRVVSWKEQADNYSYGRSTITKVLVEDDRGFRVFGTLPAELADQVFNAWWGTLAEGIAPRDFGEDYWKEHYLKGSRVTFAATTEPSEKDPQFGFFKRPSKAELLAGPTE